MTTLRYVFPKNNILNQENMGASISSNVAKVAVNAVSKIANNIIQSNEVTADSAQIIHVESTGSVVISDVGMSQVLNLKVDNLFQELSKAENKQKIAAEVAQQAKALTSGINFGQVAGSSNFINGLVGATVSIVTNLNTTCNVRANQIQKIYVNTKGKQGSDSVLIKDINMKQITELFESCISDAVSNNTTIQDLAAKFASTADASSQGLSTTGIVMIALLGMLTIGAPVIGGVVGGAKVLQFIFPVLLVIGAVLISMYVFYTKEVMVANVFSKPISVSCPSVTNSPLTELTIAGGAAAATPAAAAAKCAESAECKALSFMTYDVDAGGAITSKTQEVKYYRALPPGCKAEADTSNLLRKPTITSGAGAPGAISSSNLLGDIYLNLTTLDMYHVEKNASNVLVWVKKGKLSNVTFTGPATLSQGTSTEAATGPAAGITADTANKLVIKYDNQKNEWRLYKAGPASSETAGKVAYSQIALVSGPPLVPAAPTTPNTTGFKTLERKNWYLYVGIGMALVGVIGTAVSVYKANKTEE